MKYNLLYDRENKKFYIKEPIGKEIGAGVMAVWDERLVDVTEEILELIKNELIYFRP